MDMHEESMRRRSPAFEIVEPDILPTADVDITLCMAPITGPAKFNLANPCIVSFQADTLRSGAEAVIALLQYAHSPAGTPIECPMGVEFLDYQGIQPICFLDVRSSFHM